MSKRIVISLLSFLVSYNVLLAHNIRDYLRNMPDSLCPILSKNNRLDMIDFIDSKMKAEVSNKFEGKSEMTALTDSFADIKMSERSSVQMRLFNPTENKDSLAIAMVYSYYAPEKESILRIFSTNWDEYKIKTTNFSIDDFVQKPDTMSVERFHTLRDMISPKMVSMDLNPQNENISITLSTPFINDEEKERLKAIIKSKSVNIKNCILK